jgi:hypothetical protein
METPKNVTVLCDDIRALEGLALCQILGLLGAECHQHGLAEASSEERDEPPHELEQDLRKSPLVIAVASDESPPAGLVPLIYRMRGDSRLNWDGAFLVVAGESEDRTTMLNIDLLGDPENRFSLGRTAGHSVVFRPLQIAELLREVEQVKEIGANAWTTILKQGDAWRVASLVRDAEGFLVANRFEQAADLVVEILSLVRRIMWMPLLLDWHQDLRFVRELLEDFPDGTTPSSPLEVRSILQRVRQILLKTCVGGC